MTTINERLAAKAHSVAMRGAARLIVGVVTASALLVAVPVGVHADQFTPIPSPPVVVVQSAPGGSVTVGSSTTTLANIQPKYPDSGEDVAGSGVFTVTATVSTNATLAALASVSMCWYKDDVGADDDCVVLNPANAFEMVWTESDELSTGKSGFEVSTATGFDPNNYVNDGSQVETTTGTASYDDDAQSMTVKFSFRASNAMRAGDDWAVRVTAIYDENLCGGSPCDGLTEVERTGTDTATGLDVNYWGVVTTAQERMGFGVIAENGTSDVRSMTSFEYVANATSDYSLAGTDFRYDPNDTAAPDEEADSLELIAGSDTGVTGLTDKQVRLACRAVDPVPFPAPDFVNVSTSGVTLGAEVTATGEAPVTSGEIECTLSYSSGAVNALQIYSSVVTLSILQA